MGMENPLPAAAHTMVQNCPSYPKGAVQMGSTKTDKRFGHCSSDCVTMYSCGCSVGSTLCTRSQKLSPVSYTHLTLPTNREV